MNPLRISCLAILLRQHLLLHHEEAKIPNGRLSPALEKALQNLGNDFRIQIPWPRLDTPEVENGRSIHLQITLPLIRSPGPEETVVIALSGILAKSHSADLPPALMPSA